MREQFFRLTVLMKACPENQAPIDAIAAFAETQMPLVRGYKLIKASHEVVCSMETYGSIEPRIDKPKRTE